TISFKGDRIMRRECDPPRRDRGAPGDQDRSGRAARRHFASELLRRSRIEAATCWARTFEPSGVKWTLLGRWISPRRGRAKLYRSSIAIPLSIISARATAL